MRYSIYFSDNEKQATKDGLRDVISYNEVLAFCGGTHDDTTELLMDILNGVYTVDECLSDINDYLCPEQTEQAKKIFNNFLGVGPEESLKDLTIRSK